MIENRMKRRFSCDAEVKLDFGKRSSVGRIVEVSRGGLRLTTSARLTPGAEVTLKPVKAAGKRKPIKAVVRWIRGGDQSEVGLEFVAQENTLSRRWVRALFPGKNWRSTHQRRAQVRTPVDLPVALSDYREGHLLDLSVSGARFLIADKPADLEKLFLCLPWSLLEAESEVVRAAPCVDGWVCSVRFSGMAEQDQETLQAFVEATV